MRVYTKLRADNQRQRARRVAQDRKGTNRGKLGGEERKD